MAGEVKFIDKVKQFVGNNALAIIGVLVAFIGFLLFKMKKRNVKIFGR